MQKKVVVVTGASAGLGRAIVREFAGPNVSMALIARNPDGLLGAKTDVEALGGTAQIFPVDVADANAVQEAANTIEAELGAIEVWVNNAMLSVFSPVKEMKAEEYKRVTEVTYLGYVNGTLAALRFMLPRNRGVIVQVGSALAYRAIPLQSAYCASKHAIKGFTESLRCELIHDRSDVKVSMVHMPALNTTQFSWVKSRLPRQPQPVPPIYQPEVGAKAVVWAATHAPRELCVGYPTVQALLGEKLFPGLLDRYLAATCIEAQQTNELVNPERQDNLWQPIPGDHGAHGAFSSRSKKYSPQLWFAENKRTLLRVSSALAALFVVAKFSASAFSKRH